MHGSATSGETRRGKVPPRVRVHPLRKLEETRASEKFSAAAAFGDKHMLSEALRKNARCATSPTPRHSRAAQARRPRAGAPPHSRSRIPEGTLGTGFPGPRGRDTTPRLTP